MSDNAAGGIASEVVEAGTLVSFYELCIACDVNPAWVAGLVEQGAIEALGATRAEWRFTTVSLVRVAKAKRLERDLGLNLPGIARPRPARGARRAARTAAVAAAARCAIAGVKTPALRARPRSAIESVRSGRGRNGGGSYSPPAFPETEATTAGRG
jgi:chaperone modulatory protein CbpM